MSYHPRLLRTPHGFLLVLCCLMAVASLALAQDADFYVGPDGDDAAPGTLEEPFATVHRAQQAVRALLTTEPERDVQVLLRGGLYGLSAPLIFTAEDSSATQRVNYAAYPGEQPVLSGGRTITGWTKGEGERWTARVPEGIPPFRDLYAEGQRLTRARFPNAGEVLRVESVSEDVTEITLDTPLPADNLAGQGAELVVLQNWSISRVAVKRSDGALVVSTVPVGWIGHGAYTTASPGKAAYLEHAPAFLDQPGEWYLDAESRTLHYQAAPGEDPNTRRFVAPVLDHLLVLRGTREAPVRGLTFRGISFEHAAWRLPDIGYLGIQAAHHGTRIDAPTFALPAAIEFVYAEGCRIEHGRAAHTGASGIAFGPGCRQNAVVACTVTDIGGNGIMVGRREHERREALREDSFLAADWPDPADAPTGNEIGRNEVSRVGVVQFGAVGIFDAFSNGTHIHHNHVYDLPYTGISVGFRWDSTPTSQRAARVEHNHIHDVMKLLADGGGIYTLGLQPGTVLRGNLIHDIHRSALAHGGAPNNGIFFDEGTKGLHVEDTIIYNTSGDPIRFNQTNADNLTWGTNYFGIAPDDEAFPSALAGQAGP
jgi:hypothetical protein